MKKKIFIVEDTAEALENLKDLLKMEGFEIITAVNGEEAMFKFYLYVPDVIITDLRMPKMDGFSFIEKVKSIENLKSIPIIVFSANATPENEAKVLHLGAAMFLKKPCPTEKLLESIQEVLTNAEASK